MEPSGGGCHTTGQWQPLGLPDSSVQPTPGEGRGGGGAGGGEEKGQPYLVYNPHLVRGGGGKRGGLGGGDEAVGDQRKRCSWPGLVCAGCRSRAGCYATHA